MKRTLFAMFALTLSQGALALDGPFSHRSDGYTQPIIQWDPSGSRITYIECTPGSRCAIRTGTRALGRYDTQTMTFDLRTGPSARDHYAFSVRGDQSNAVCTGTSRIASNPLLGRGIAVYPQMQTIFFENFTEHCVNRMGAGGLIRSTASWAAFEPRTRYSVTVWANDTNVGAIVYKHERDDYGAHKEPIFATDCLASAASHERHLCGSFDAANANRTFIASTADEPWIVSNWYID